MVYPRACDKASFKHSVKLKNAQELGCCAFFIFLKLTVRSPFPHAYAAGRFAVGHGKAPLPPEPQIREIEYLQYGNELSVAGNVDNGYHPAVRR